MKKEILTYGTMLSIAAFLTGCGGGGSSSGGASQTGYLVDAPVANATYDCVADGEIGKTTGADGSFTCHNMHVRFRIGNLVLGEINALPEDALVYPQDIVGVPREHLDDPRVVEMARMIQSMDADADLSNGIQIGEHTKAAFDEEMHFDPNHVENYLDMANVDPAHERHENEAKEHLAQTMQTMEQQQQHQQEQTHNQNEAQEHQQDQAGNMQEHQNEAQEHQQDQAGNMQEHQNEAQEHQQNQAGNMQEHQNEAQEHNRA